MSSDNNGQKVVKAGLWYTVGNMLVKGIAFLTIPVFTYLMSTEQYGMYNTYAAYMSILAVVVSLGLPSSVRNVRYDMPKNEKEYHVNSLLLMLFTLFAALALLAVFHTVLEKILGFSALLIAIVVINSSSTAFHSYYNNILTIDYRYPEFLKISFFYSVSSVGLSVLLIQLFFQKESALGRALGNMIPMVFIMGYVIVRVFRRNKIQLRRKYTRYGLKFGLPLIPNDLSSLVLAQFDRIMIFRTIGEAAAGLYSFAYNVAVLYQVITVSVESAWTPWMFSKLHDKDYKDLKKKINIYIGVITLCTSMLILASPELIMILSRKIYWDSRSVVIPIILAMYFFAVATIPVGIEFFHKKTTIISGCTFCTAICNIVLNFIFIPKYGYQAAAYTTLVCYLLYCIFHMFMAAKMEPVNMLAMPMVLMGMGMVILVSFAGIVMLNIPWIRWGAEAVLCLLTGLGLVRYRQTVKQIWYTIRRK